jgi:hypothetical protein
MQSKTQTDTHQTAVSSSLLGKRVRPKAEPGGKGGKEMTLEASMATTTSGSSRPDPASELTLEKFQRMEQKLCELQETQRLIRQKLAEQMLEDPEEKSATHFGATEISLEEAAGKASICCAKSESQLRPANSKSPDNLSEDSDGSFSAEV